MKRVSFILSLFLFSQISLYTQGISLSAESWRFSGKEEFDDAFGLPQSDFGARFYDRMSWTKGCIRILDEDMKELYDIIKSLEDSDPLETKGFVNVANDLPAPVKYRDREYIKDNWERNLGELDPAILTIYK